MTTGCESLCVLTILTVHGLEKGRTQASIRGTSTCSGRAQTQASMKKHERARESRQRPAQGSMREHKRAKGQHVRHKHLQQTRANQG
eukprot:1161705-Pelagomonas_calceolata.AAC.1